MNLRQSETLRWYALVAGLAAVLLLLAGLQYRSVEAVSAATKEQMLTSLQGTLMDVRQSLDAELSQLCREMSGADPGRDRQFAELATRFDRWRQASAHSALVAGVYLWQREGGRSELQQINSAYTRFEEARWPDDLRPLRQHLLQLNPIPAPPDGGGSPRATSDARHSPEPPASRELDRHEPRGARYRAERRRNDRADRPMRFAFWMIDESGPALLHPLPQRPDRGPRSGNPNSPAWLVIVLDRAVLGQQILPELIRRYFGSDERSAYQVAVIDKTGRAPAVYMPTNWTSLNGAEPDAALNLFGRPLPVVARSEDTAGRMIPLILPTIGALPASSPPDTGEFEHGGGRRLSIEPLGVREGGQDWEVVARHRQGSVEAAVSSLSRRNLVFNFAVLLVLAATMAMIIGASVRARRLGRLQMDFVANVSHELRTPLTGIVSAAENIADGVISDKERLALYGKAIVHEAHQLSDLVEQILQFAAVEKNGDRYHFHKIDIAEVIEASLGNTSTLIQSAGITVEQNLQPGLPQVSADFKALSRCLQNLIGNAIKYGGDQRWLGLRAWTENGAGGKTEVCLSVADKGIGIEPQELEHIFEPFYRTPEVSAAQIHGSGLGLPIARRIAEAMGGRITVESAPGKGSTFTLHLPALSGPAVTIRAHGVNL
jgi:two-component system sensor histidine kinase SenX3